MSHQTLSVSEQQALFRKSCKAGHYFPPRKWSHKTVPSFLF
uniref:Uncharacterized protein n=1 Tax=Anguilla anguilla TaxID=7936 RepID=A0A0E9VK64_ANGAN